MTQTEPSQSRRTFAGQWRDFSDRVFVDRQILIRSEGAVSYISVSKNAQKVGATLAAGLFGFGLWSVGAILMQEAKIAERNQTIAETNLAYSSVVEEMTATQRRFVQLATEIQSEQSKVISLLEERSTLRESLNKLESANEATTPIGDSKADIVRRLEEIESELVVAYDQDTNSARLASLQRLSQHNSEQSESALTTIATTLDRNPNLFGNTDIIRRYIRAAEIRLRGVVEERDTARAEGQKLSNKFILTERRIAALKAAQQEFVEQLAERTDVQIASLENTIQKTGLDPEILVQRFSARNMGQGGPANTIRTVALNAVKGNELDLGTENQIATLEHRLNRWTALHEIIEAMPLSSPVDYYYVSSRFGKRRDPFTKKWARHHGVDLAASLNTPILASAPGKVIYAGYRAAYGRMVEVDHGNGITTRYGHLNKVLVKKGTEVNHRDKLGLMGSTGRSTGSHLHYEVRFDDKAIDPAPFIRAGRTLLRGS